MNTKPIIVKIAVKMEPELPQLIEFNQNVDLSIIIEDLCSNWGIINADKYALKFENHEVYVTEKNRTEIKNGSVLILTFSPTKMAREIIEALKLFSEGKMNRSNKKTFNLQNLSEMSTDETFSIAFINENGLVSLTDFIEKNKYQGSIMLVNALDSCIKIMKHEIVSWDILGSLFITSITNFVNNLKIQEMKIVQCSLSILESIVLNCNDKYDQIKNAVKFPKQLIQRLENENLKQNVLSLINALFLKADSNAQQIIADTLFSEEYRGVFQKIIKIDEMRHVIAHQLYVTQTLYLNSKLEERMNTTIDPQDQNINDKLKELSKIEFNWKTIGGEDSSGIHLGPFVMNNKLGFTDEENAAMDFTSTPPGMLAFDCIVYFAENYIEDYLKVILENSCRTDKHACPVGRCSVEIVRVLCKQLKIGEPPSEYKIKYLQLLFSHKCPFHELYRVCITYTSKIWREMMATAEDFGKVLNIAMSQINCAMNSKPEPTDFESLAQKLSTQTYARLNSQWQSEIFRREKRLSYLRVEEKIAETVKPELIQLIKTQRLNYMAEGTRFVIEQGGREKRLFARLAKSHKFLLYGDGDDATTTVNEELKNVLRVIDIKSLSSGKDNVQIARGCKSQLLFSLTIESKDEPFSLIAPNEKAYDYWIDGINALLGNEMTSKEAENDLSRLLTMEIKIRTLEDE